MLSERTQNRQSLATYLVLLLGLTPACTEKVETPWKLIGSKVGKQTGSVSEIFGAEAHTRALLHHVGDVGVDNDGPALHLPPAGPVRTRPLAQQSDG